jgi:hypothetical protein
MGSALRLRIEPSDVFLLFLCKRKSTSRKSGHRHRKAHQCLPSLIELPPNAAVRARCVSGIANAVTHENKGTPNHLAMESTLADALQVVFGERPSAVEGTTVTPQAPLSGAREALSRADEALRRGDWSAFGREWERLKNLFEK